ncbi:cytochrome P450 [Lactarius hatsudake]|nr:cytochrome P450 [Lactarius hatsudake]
MAQQIISGGLLFAFCSVDDRWRHSRRAAHQSLTKAAVRNYHSILRKEGVLLTSALLADPRALEKHFKRTTASTMMSILYDYPTLRSENEKSVKEAFAHADRMSESIDPGAYFVELLPWMLHTPESVTGAETTSTTMSWWTLALAMIVHPEVQKRAHIELVTVVGRSRTPTLSDAPNLPYIQAIVREILRWRPSLPLSLPHSTTEDDWYNGMFIPKGTICLPNLFQFNRDPSYGDDAANFRPERFLDAHDEILPGPAETREDGHGAYGIGKRACVGKHIANESLFIYIATALWALTLEQVRDEDGNGVPLDVDKFVDTGITIRPGPYECKITPRFGEVVSILAAEKELLKT